MDGERKVGRENRKVCLVYLKELGVLGLDGNLASFGSCRGNLDVLGAERGQERAVADESLAELDVRRQVSVVLQAREHASGELVRLVERGERELLHHLGREELDGLARAHQLDAEDFLHVADEVDELPDGVSAHGDVVLLSRAGRDGVARRRMDEDLVLAGEPSGDVLRDHEAVVQPRRAFGEQERGEPGEVGGRESVDPSLRHGADVLDRHRGDVRRLRRVLSVEVAAGEDLAFDAVRAEDQRVVRGAVELLGQDLAAEAQSVDGDAVHLRAAADDVPVLHLVHHHGRVVGRPLFLAPHEVEVLLPLLHLGLSVLVLLRR